MGFASGRSEGQVERRLTLTPGTARMLLARNTANRPMDREAVEGIKRRLEAGGWNMDGSDGDGPIKFYGDGTLANGQHRLQAVAEMPDHFSITVTVGSASARVEEDSDVADSLARKYSLMKGCPENYHLIRAAMRAHARWNEGTGTPLLVRMMNGEKFG
jgi:hypothetical protein